MKNSDIIIEIENLSIYFASLEQQVKNVSRELNEIEKLLKSLKECLNEKRSDDS
jgi:hypothetical protein